MHTAIANYMLPTMQIVCHLVVLENGPGTNVTTPVPDSDQTTPHPQPTLRPLPEGYVAHPDVGFAYKVYDESVTLMDAKRRCIEEGAQLALIDSAKKLEYIDLQSHTTPFAHVGIIRMYDDEMWVAVSTGLPVSTIPWKDGNPSGDSDCVAIFFGNNFGYKSGLGNYPCSNLNNYICEIPILEKKTDS